MPHYALPYLAALFSPVQTTPTCHDGSKPDLTTASSLDRQHAARRHVLCAHCSPHALLPVAVANSTCGSFRRFSALVVCSTANDVPTFLPAHLRHLLCFTHTHTTPAHTHAVAPPPIPAALCAHYARHLHFLAHTTLRAHAARCAYCTTRWWALPTTLPV